MLWLFDTLGLIFGPAVFLAGIAALVLCVRATRNTSTARSQRTAMWASFGPFVLGVCAMVVGLVVWVIEARATIDPATAFLNSGKAALAGLVVTLLPLAWALTLRRTRRQPA
jgi:hypothetical protein